jgi:hypothetical protein
MLGSGFGFVHGCSREKRPVFSTIPAWCISGFFNASIQKLVGLPFLLSIYLAVTTTFLNFRV